MMVWSYSIFGADMLAIFGKGAERGRCMCWLLHTSYLCSYSYYIGTYVCSHSAPSVVAM